MSCDGLIEPFNYKEMIDNYFYTHYPNCDRNICHFFSGKIRELKFYETSYFKYGDDEEKDGGITLSDIDVIGTWSTPLGEYGKD